MLNYCIVKQRIGAIAEDDPDDDDRYPNYRTVSGDVTFTPILPQGKAYQIVDSEGIAHTAPALRIAAKIVNGEITHEGEPGVHLFAAGENSNPPTIAYNVVYSNLNAGGIPVTLSGISFVAIPGAAIDLSTVTPIAGTPGLGITKGDKGDSVTVTGYHFDEAGDSIIEFSDGSTAVVKRGIQGLTGPAVWDDVKEKPTVYPPESHTHPDYATTVAVNGVSGRVTTLEGSAPIIVSDLPSSPLPGRIYLVTG